MNISLNPNYQYLNRTSQPPLRKSYLNQNTSNPQNLSFGAGSKLKNIAPFATVIIAVVGMIVPAFVAQERNSTKQAPIEEQTKALMPEVNACLEKNGAVATLKNVSGKIIATCEENLKKVK